MDKREDLSYITDENGNDVAIDVISEFERSENGKKFVIYTDYSEDEDEQKEYYVAEIVLRDDGEEELVEIEDEDDLNYCQNVFDELVEKMMGDSLSDSDEEEIVSA